MNEQTEPLTFEEHRQMGGELRGMTARIRELHRLAQDVYGGESPAAARFGETLEALVHLCDGMQAQAATDLSEHQARGLYAAR